MLCWHHLLFILRKVQSQERIGFHWAQLWVSLVLFTFSSLGLSRTLFSLCHFWSKICKVELDHDHISKDYLKIRSHRPRVEIANNGCFVVFFCRSSMASWLMCRWFECTGCHRTQDRAKTEYWAQQIYSIVLRKCSMADIVAAANYTGTAQRQSLVFSSLWP